MLTTTIMLYLIMVFLIRKEGVAMFKLSTKGRYAVRIMVYLATQEANNTARKQDIAESESISPDYVEQILIRLRAGGLVMSHRGARGGFSLACDPRRTSVMDVLEATEGPLEIAPCRDTRCDRGTHCVVQGVWEKAASALKGVLSKVLIADLAAKVVTMKENGEISYTI